MDIATVEQGVKTVVGDLSPSTFIFQLLAAYGQPKSSITRLQNGTWNLSKVPGEVLWKKQFLFRSVEDVDLHTLTDQLRKSQEVAKHKLRFVITTDFVRLLAVDTKTQETLDIELGELPKHADFFLPWAGHEKHRAENENHADIKAAYAMGRLYERISKDNPDLDGNARHALNVFFARLLFCFFAEDTEIFPQRGMFTSCIKSHTMDDGSDLAAYLSRLFHTLSIEDRSSCAAFLQAFPYVNGGLFADSVRVPTLSRLSREMIVDCGELDWSEINPDIFGSVMQSVVSPENRGEKGMHYTSMTNIMKVLKPLFLDELWQSFEDNLDNSKELERLRARLRKIRVFDPACGSGNFLIIAFKELRKLEMEIYLRLRELNPTSYQTMFTLPEIRLTQFLGIEIDDFAHEIAVLSLWLAEHQMNVKFKENLGVVVPPLPLKPSGRIVCGNATRLDWNEVCPKERDLEIYLLGNPPYNGSKKQTFAQKEDMAKVFRGAAVHKSLDYIASWFVKASDYIEGTAHKCAFVCTNSLTQGDQVSLLWPLILNKNQEIFFAHKTFKWGNNARNKAGVACVVIGICEVPGPKEKVIFDGTSRTVAKNINPYLVDAANRYIGKRTAPISKLPAMVYGNMSLEGNFLKLDAEERDELLSAHPEAKKFLRKLTGGDEFLAGLKRWCLWIESEDLEEALSLREIRTRIEKVKEFREKGGDVARTLVARSHQFRYRKEAQRSFILVPCTSSEKRDYLQCGFFDREYIPLHSAQVIYDSDPYIFGVVSSKMHMVWTKATAGALESRIRYSAQICYNNFPIPELTEKQRQSIESHVFDVLSEREKHPEKTIAQLYDPESMPAGLLKAHRDLDLAVERCYRSRPFGNDEDRLDYLFSLYEDMTR